MGDKFSVLAKEDDDEQPYNNIIAVIVVNIPEMIFIVKSLILSK